MRKVENQHRRASLRITHHALRFAFHALERSYYVPITNPDKIGIEADLPCH